MPDIAFETARLQARRLHLTDVDTMLGVYGDQEVVRWAGDGKTLNRALCEKWVEVTLNNYATRGYGMFALVDRESGAVVGFAGLVHPGGQPEAEIKRAGSAKLNRRIRVDLLPMGEDIARERSNAMRRPRRNHTAAFKAKVALGGVQGRQDAGGAGASSMTCIRNQITRWKTQLLDGATDVFCAASRGTDEPPVDLKALHAKIGQLALENRFFGRRARSRRAC